MDSLDNGNKQVINEDDEAWMHSSVIASSFVLPMILHATIELNVLEIIHQAAAVHGAELVSPSYIVSKLPQPARNNKNAPSVLDRMLRLLASHSLLSCSTLKLENGGFERLYGLTRAGKFFLKSTGDNKGSLASISLLYRFQSLAFDLRYCIKDAVLEGVVPFNKAHNMPCYEYLGKNPETNKSFDKAMSDHSSILMDQILRVYEGFDGLTSLVDVGGGNGTTLNMIISKYPSVRGINFDLPRVITNKSAPFYKGIEHVVGDMFKEVPQGNAILLKAVLHNWCDEECLRILKNCYAALPADDNTGKVIVVELDLPETIEASTDHNLAKFASQLDNIMLMKMGFGAKERTENEYKALAMAAGFSSFQVACHVFGHCVMEFYK